MGLSFFPSLSPSPTFLIFPSSLRSRLSLLLIVSLLALSPSSGPLPLSVDSGASVSHSPSFSSLSSLQPSSSSPSLSPSFSSLFPPSLLFLLCQSVLPRFPFAWSSHSSSSLRLFPASGVISVEAHSDSLPEEKNQGVCLSYSAINRYLASFYGVPSFTCSRQGTNSLVHAEILPFLHCLSFYRVSRLHSFLYVSVQATCKCNDVLHIPSFPLRSLFFSRISADLPSLNYSSACIHCMHSIISISMCIWAPSKITEGVYMRLRCIGGHHYLLKGKLLVLRGKPPRGYFLHMVVSLQQSLMPGSLRWFLDRATVSLHIV